MCVCVCQGVLVVSSGVGRPNKPPCHMGSSSLARDPISLSFGGCVKGWALWESLSGSRLLQAEFSFYAREI